MRQKNFQNLVLPIILVGLSGAGPTPAADGPFLAQNATAMNKMMAAMDVRPSGDVDADFIATMIPHHQGAIDMAQAELRYGHNECCASRTPAPSQRATRHTKPGRHGSPEGGGPAVRHYTPG